MARIFVGLMLLSSMVIAQNQNVSNGVVFDGEPYLSINPNDPQHVVVAWMSWIDFSEQFKIKTRVSLDGGDTWSAPVTLPHTVNGYTSADPSAAFDENGNVVVCYIDFTGTTPPVTGGVYICRSTDGGLSFGSPMEVISTNYDGTKWPIDRPWMVIDRSAGSNAGNIYVTTFNLNRNQPSFNPYLSVSNDGGNTFTHRYLDTIGWLAGNLNPLPMCSPAVSSSGVFHGVYPSYELSQSFLFRSFLVSSADGGLSLDHKIAQAQITPANSTDYPDARKAGLLLCDPSDSGHLASIFLSTQHGDPDIFLTETYDAGSNWTAAIRLNDDPIGNNRMQDMLWGDFDTDGSLVVSWRDRRNGADSTFQTASEIWATYRHADSAQFASNFQITDQTVAYDSVLTYAGNDFMCIELNNGILNATWGDTRNGKLNIWFQKMNVDGSMLSVQQLASEEAPNVQLYPNPTSDVLVVESNDLQEVSVYDLNGNLLLAKQIGPDNNQVTIGMKQFTAGTYFIELKTADGAITKRVVKN